MPLADHRRDVARLMEALAIPRDGVLFMHSSFRRLGACGYQAEGFLEALCDYLHRGTVLLPAMSWRLVTPANPIFDELQTPSITGILTELFRRNFATHRSLHPTHSVAGRGEAAAALLGTHHLDATPCSDRSPTGLLAPHEGHVMLLGVEMDSCTLVHHSEEKFAPDIYLRPEIEHYICRDRSGRDIAVPTRRHKRLARNFWQFEDFLAKEGGVRYAELGGTLCRAFRARDMLRVMNDRLALDPAATIAKPGERFKLM